MGKVIRERKSTEITVTIDGREYTEIKREPAILKCDCGEHIELHGFTNTCYKCESDYNMSGQLLAPREQWGYETGESLFDIFNGHDDDY